MRLPRRSSLNFWCATTRYRNWLRSSKTPRTLAGVRLGISKQNLLYYASLASFYTVHDLRHLKEDQTHLYLLCYAWKRFRQLSDNLVDAMAYHMKKLEEETSAGEQKSFMAEQIRRQQDTPKVGAACSVTKTRTTCTRPARRISAASTVTAAMR